MIKKVVMLKIIALLLVFIHIQSGNGQDRVVSTDGAFCAQLVKVLPFQNNLVAYNTRSEIFLLSPDGKIIKKTGGYGSGKESFGSLLDICAFRNISIYAVDMDRQRILNFDYNLNLVGSLVNNSNWPENVQFTQPTALQLAQTGEWFLIDNGDPRLINIDIHGNPQWAYAYPLGGEQKYWQDIRLLTINTDQRMLYLYDYFYKTVFVLDYWGNLLRRYEPQGEVSSIFFRNKIAFYLSQGHIYGFERSPDVQKLNAKIAQYPGEVKFITTGKDTGQLIILSDKILVLMNE